MGWNEDLSCFYFARFFNFRRWEFWVPLFINLHCGVQTIMDCIVLGGGCDAGGVDQNFVSIIICSELDR